MIFSAPVSIFNVLPQGGSFDYPPLAAITHFWGILDSVSNFQCATPRGLIRLPTVGCNYSLLGHFGLSFKFSMCYPKGAHSFTHRWLQLLTFGAFLIQFQIFNVLPQGGSFVYSPLAAITHFWGILDLVSNFQCATPRGLIRLLTVGCNYSLLGHFGFSFKFSMCCPKGAHSFTHRWLQLLTSRAFWIKFQIFNVLPQGGSFDYPPLAAITHFWGILDSVSNFQCATPRGLIRLPTVGCNYSLLGHFGLSFKFSMCYPKGAHSITHRCLQLPTFWAFWIKFQIFNVLPQGGSFDYPPLAAITHFLGILD